MDNLYKLTLYSNNIYKEVDLLPDVKQISIGTLYDNTVRLKKDLFLEDFYVTASQPEDGSWELECSPNIYFYLGDIRKMFRVSLKHGDDIGLRYQEADGDFLKISFSINFDNKERQFRDEIPLDGISALTIGSSSRSDIVLTDQYVAGDALVLRWNGPELELEIKKTRYGVMVNGIAVDRKALIRDCDFISVGDYQFYYKNKCLYTDITDQMVINGIAGRHGRQESHLKYPVFNRNIRVKSLIPLDPIPVLDPPEKPEKPKNNLLMSILPAFAMLILTIVIRGFMSENGSGTFVIFSACTIGMGIITSIASFVQGNKEYKKNVQEREAKYTQYIAEKSRQIEACRDKENEILQYNYPDFSIVSERVDTFSGDLFDRTRADEDFLDVRIGLGSMEALRKVSYNAQERFVSDDRLACLPEQTRDKYLKISDCPIVLQLREANAVGIVGEEVCRYEFAKNMILDLVSHQYKDDLKLACILDEEQKEKFAWIRFLPHVRTEGSYLRMIACDADSRTNLFENLYKEFSRRAEPRGKSDKDSGAAHIVVFVLDSARIMTHPLSKFIQIAASIHVTFIFFEKYKEALPLGITKILYVSDGSAEIVDTADRNSRNSFVYETIADQMAEKMARRLAPVYCPEVNLEGGLVKTISLFELLDIYSVEDLDLTSRWEAARTDRSMAAPLGVKTKKEIVSLDIHEKAHGPHGLVAGTTGSGKSEILQSYILSMATLYHPYEVGFLLIDFKGGGMANQFSALPHLMGTITDIDGKQIDRSLKSIKAEIDKRKRYFAEAEVNHIDKYIMKFKGGEIEKPLPHLIIIVDEFAELRAEYPEFMKELVSASRIGRSLGVHLILATQKPSGQVSEQIWSNSRFKLCLKVQSPEDSNEMIKSPMAAEILEPGRAYFQVGNNEIFELFQSGFSGAPEKASADTLSSREYSLSEITFEGKKKNIFTQSAAGESGARRTQLEALVEYVHGYCDEKDIVKLDNICLPELPELIGFPAEMQKGDTLDCTVEIGILDDPERQRQIPVSVNFSQDNIMVVGASQYGKTNLLQLVIRGLCTQYTPEEVNIYILDFGSMILRNFDTLKHVGGVVVPSEDEKFKNLMKLLLTEIETRKEKLMQAGVSSFVSYREAGFTDIPQIVLLIDNYTAVREYYLQEEDPILQICREGIAVGISTVMANAQTSGMGYRYMSNFAKRIVFYCNESGEYSNVIEKCRTAPDNIAGRALTEIDKQIYELQTYLSFEGEREIERITGMRSFVEFTNSQNTSAARRIPVIPEVLEMEDFVKNYGAAVEDTYIVPLGLYYDPIAPVQIDLLDQGWFAIAGRGGMGKRNLLHVVLAHLHKNMFSCPADVYIVDSIDRKLAEFRDMGIVQEYTIDAADAVTYIEEIYTELSRRYQDSAGGKLDLAEEPLKLVVIGNRDAMDAVSKNAAVVKEYKELTGRLKSMKVCFIFMDVANAAIGYNAPEMLKAIKDSKNLFYFDDLQNLKLCDISAVTLRRFKKKIVKGDGYWLAGNEIAKVKIVKREG